MRIRNHQDFWAGLMFAAIGILFAGFAQQYDFGAAARMGPGYFPTMLGILLMLLGLLVSWRSTAKSQTEHRLEPTGWREILLVLGAVIVFGLTLPWLGMVAAIALLILISAVAAHDYTWKETIISMIVLLAVAYLVFVKGLELQFPVWPKFLTAA